MYCQVYGGVHAETWRRVRAILNFQLEEVELMSLNRPAEPEVHPLGGFYRFRRIFVYVDSTDYLLNNNNRCIVLYKIVVNVISNDTV